MEQVKKTVSARSEFNRNRVDIVSRSCNLLRQAGSQFNSIFDYGSKAVPQSTKGTAGGFGEFGEFGEIESPQSL